MKIAVIGTGYVGLVTGTCFAEMGNQVICLDLNKERIENLKKGKIPIFEPGLEELVISNVREKRLKFTTSYREALEKAELTFIAVGTPPKEDGAADLSHVLKVAEMIGQTINNNQIIINKSTVPVGTCHKIKTKIMEALKERKVSELQIEIADNPEFLKEGSAVDDFLRPDRIIIGIDNNEIKPIFECLYASFTRNGHPIYFMDIKSAELSKYAANAMLASRISFMNEIALLCDQLGADVSQIRLGIGADKRIGMDFLYAGLGYGGSCFPKDIKALIKMGVENNIKMPMISAIAQTNYKQSHLFVEIVKKHFNYKMEDKIFAVWGLAFKPLTDDMREAPAITIIKELVACGAKVQAYDPKALKNAKTCFSQEYEKGQVSFSEDMMQSVKSVDALLLLTEWRQFRQVDFIELKEKMQLPIIFDGRNQYDIDTMRGLGFTYYCIGRNKCGE